MIIVERFAGRSPRQMYAGEFLSYLHQRIRVIRFEHGEDPDGPLAGIPKPEDVAAAASNNASTRVIDPEERKRITQQIREAFGGK